MKSHYLKVFYSIVCLVAILVVNHFAVCKFSAEKFFHNPSVFQDHNSIDIPDKISCRDRSWHPPVYEQDIRIAMKPSPLVMLTTQAVSMDRLVAHGANLLGFEIVPHDSQYIKSMKIVNTGDSN